MGCGPIDKLPILVTAAIFDNVDFPISLEEAKKIRLELIKECKRKSDISEYFTTQFGIKTVGDVE